MGSFDLHRYVQEVFRNVERGPEDMRPYQHTAVDFVLDNPFCALFIDVGMGKSCISLSAIMHLIQHHDEVEHWLVVAPKRVVNETWPTEIGLWRHTAPLTFAHIREDEVVDAVNVAGRAERRKIDEELLWQGLSKSAIKEKMKGLAAKQRIEKARLVASRKAVRDHFRRNPSVVHLISRDHVEFLVDAWGKDFPYKGIVVDESSSLKDHKTGRFKALRRIRPLLKRMIQLTATPAAETYLHLFPQIYLLDEGQRLGKSITHYREEYFTYNQYTHKYKIKPGAEERIAEKIADIALTLKAEDYLDLEKPIMLMEKVALSAEQRTLYETMEREYVVTLPSGEEIEAETAAALSQKLLQMASGVLYEAVLEPDCHGSLKKRRVVHILHDHKIEKLQTIVEEVQSETLLVAYWHESSLDRLKKAFPKAVVMDDEGKCIKDWNMGKIPMLLVHPQSAGHGLNIQHGGRRIVYFDIPWSLELYEQLNGRLDGARQLARKEDMRVVFIHHLIAEGTLDEAVAEALSEKRDAQELLFTLLKKMRHRRSRFAY